MDPRVAAAWELLEEEIEEYDSFYLTHTNERIGDYVRAWCLLEDAWRAGVTIDDVIQSVNFDRIVLQSDAERLLWLSDLMGTLGYNLVLDHISPVLDAVVLQHSMRLLDVTPYFGTNVREYGETRMHWAAERLSTAIHRAHECLNDDEAALLLGMTRSDLESVVNADDPGVRLAWIPDEGPESQLRRFAKAYPEHPEGNLGLGSFLALSGQAASALPFLDMADQQSWKMLSDSRVAIARYVYVDCCAALGSRPDRTFSDLIDIPHIQAFADGLYTHNWNNRDYYFICRSWMVLEGRAKPFASTSTLPKPESSFEAEAKQVAFSAAEIPEALDWWQAQVEPLHREQLQTRTDIGLLKVRLGRDQSRRDEFLIDQITQLMPRQRRQRVIDDLRRRIANWGPLPQGAKDQLVAARYLSDDPELSALESTSIVLMAIALATEVTARRYMRLGEGYSLGHVIEHLENVTTAEWISKLRELRDLRNSAAHGLTSPPRLAVDNAWSLILSTTDSRGLLDDLVEFAKHRQARDSR